MLVKVHYLRYVHIFRQSEAEIAEKLNVLRKARKPLLSADNVRRTHKVVIDSVCEMIRRYAVGLEENEVLVVFRDLHIAFYKVCEFYFLFGVAVRKYAENKRHSRFEICFNLFDGKVSSRKHFRFSLSRNRFPVRIFYLFFFVYLLKLLKLFFRRKARIRLAFADELLCKDVIDWASETLLVRSVNALIADLSVLAEDCSLVKIYSVCFKRSDKCLCRTGDFSLCVRVLYAKIKNAAALMSQSVADGAREKSSEMNKSRRTGGKSRNLCALGKYSRGITLFHILRRLSDVRKKKIGKIIVIH